MADTAWPQVLRALIGRQELTEEQASWAMEQMLAGQATDAQISGFVVALRAKGETAAEVRSLVATMARHANTFTTTRPAIDIVGTGGDQANTVNISTMSALVVAACGVPVAKHGNRAASSQTGTADVLEELGIVIELSPDQVRQCVEEVGIGFAFAPRHHPAMRHVGPVRRELGVPTVFNILGPLSNPAGAAAMLVGVADAERAPVIAEVLGSRGVRALVVRGDDGLDEISTTTTSTVWDATGGAVRRQTLSPGDLGVRPVQPAMLVGGDPARNARLLRQVIGADPIGEGEAARVAAIRDVVAVNAAAALVAYAAVGAAGAGGAAGGDAGTGGAGGDAVAAGDAEASLAQADLDEGSLHDRIAEQLGRAREALASGAAADVLQRWVAFSQALGQG